MDIIPSLDILDRKVVRVFKCATHNPADLTYHAVDMAKQFARLGFKRMQLVDLSDDQKFIEQTVEELINLSLSVQVQGAINSVDKAKSYISAGADRVVVDYSDILKDQSLYLSIMNAVGLDKLAVSVKDLDDETSIKDVIDQVLEKLNIVKHLMVTNKEGVDIDLYKKVCVCNPDVHVTASGGIFSLTSLEELDKCGVKHVVISRALYEDEAFRDEVVTEYNKQLLPF